ncbi:thioesterase family protein [Salinibacterium sp. SYSU T00001]|uniref:acyl-CoA thioesterase n=1 Tax=Homoserinimonas sedimenticola TaxID=2986805 RepID=UPI0022355B86|nr:thioesterase family protein [Salinibacterium sedimenticola]MCW4384727.1 thioesterase family protein [Salinibacterium sedimenticola]
MRINIPVHLRWGDLDAYQHVNNVEIFRLLEEARVRAFWAPADPEEERPPTAVFEPGGESLSLISGHRIEYLRPLDYQRAPVDVAIWFTEIGAAMARIGYEVYDGTSDAPRVRAASTMVFVQEDGYRPRRISEVERAAWSPYLGDPVPFSRRS